MRSLRVGTTEQLPFPFSLSRIGEGNGNSLRFSCLENPRDGGAWWAAVYGVAQSRTRVKRLSSSSSSRPVRVAHTQTCQQQGLERSESHGRPRSWWEYTAAAAVGESGSFSMSLTTVSLRLPAITLLGIYTTD